MTSLRDFLADDPQGSRRGQEPAWYPKVAGRWQLIVDDLEARGGVHEDGALQWAAELGIYKQSLTRALGHLHELGVVRIIARGARSTSFGGRTTNRYELLMTWAQWSRHAPALWAERARAMDRLRQAKHRAKARERKLMLTESQRLRQQRDELTAVAAERIERALRIADARAGIVDETLVDDSDLLGWS